MPSLVGALIMLLVAGTTISAVAEDLFIVRDGHAQATVVVRSEAPQVGPEHIAAKELVQFIAQMSGAHLPVVNDTDDAEGTKIVLKLKPGTAHPRYDGYWLHTNGGDIIIQATEPKGCLLGVYGLLHELGCRWYSHPEIATVIPKRPTLSVPGELDVRREPAFKSRHSIYPATAVQAGRTGYNYCRAHDQQHIDAAHKRGMHTRLFLHGWPKLVTRKYDPEEGWQEMDFAGHEDWLPMNEEGQRVANEQTLCFSNPEARDWFADNAAGFVAAHPDVDLFSLWPADLGGVAICRCESCQRRGWTATDWYLMVHNEIRKRLDQHGWEGRFGWIAYHGTRDKPEHVALYNHGKAMDFLYAPCIRKAGHYGSFTSETAINSAYRSRLNGWLDYLAQQDYQGTTTVFEYYFDMVNSMFTRPPQRPVGRALLSPLPEIMQEDIRFYRDKGFDGFYDCSLNLLWPDPLGKWLFIELLWNPDLDLDAARDDFFRNYYGAAAQVMKETRARLQQTIRAGLAQENVEKIRALDSSFAQALELVPEGDVISTRIKAARLHAKFAALCLESEVAQYTLKDKQRAVEVEHSIVDFVTKHSDFLLDNGFSPSGRYSMNVLSGYGVNKRLEVLGAAD